MSGQVYEFNGKTLVPIQSQGLAIGQRVRQAHKYEIGVITEETNHGYTVIFDDGEISHGQRLGALSPYTRIEVVDGIEPLALVEELKRKAEERKIADRVERDRLAAQKAIDTDRFVKELQAEYPWAKQGKPSANLKKELTLAFPGVKFSVRYSSYSGGDSIDVFWTDGPTSKEVEAISGKYQDGHFDGMQDLHEYDHSAYGEAIDRVLGRAKYVSESRRYSERFIKDMILEVCFEYGFDELPVVKMSGDYPYIEGGNQPYCQGAHPTRDLKWKIMERASQTRVNRDGSYTREVEQ